MRARHSSAERVFFVLTVCRGLAAATNPANQPAEVRERGAHVEQHDE